MAWPEDEMTWADVQDAELPTPRERADAVLRDVKINGGTAIWSELQPLGHSFSTIKACVRRGELVETCWPNKQKTQIVGPR